MADLKEEVLKEAIKQVPFPILISIAVALMVYGLAQNLGVTIIAGSVTFGAIISAKIRKNIVKYLEDDKLTERYYEQYRQYLLKDTRVMVTIFRSRQTIELKKLEQDEQLELAKLEAVYDELRTEVDPERKVILKAKIPFIDARLKEIEQRKQELGADQFLNQGDIRQRLWGYLRSIMQNRLEGWLEDEIRAELKLTFQPQAVVNRQFRLDKGEQTLRADEDILSVFDKASWKLLILGAPGAGKTITLFRLGLQLLARAEQPTELLPMVFELSNWVLKRKRLQDWLADELGQLTSSNPARWRSWVDPTQPRILPLLDGLDEVPPEYLAECIETINTYCKSVFVHAVVCCRSGEYGQVEGKLHLRGVVELQPLTHDQIKTYLSTLGAKANALQIALATDSALLELARTPLLLNMLILAYRGNTPPTKEHLFSQYVARCFEASNIEGSYYRPTQTIRYLQWLAQQMEKRHWQEFTTEHINLSWLNTSNEKYYVYFTGIIWGLVIFIIFTLIFSLFFSPAIGVVAGTLLGLEVGLMARIIIILIEIEISSKLGFTKIWLSSKPGFLLLIIICLTWLISSLIVALSLGLIVNLVFQLNFAAIMIFFLIFAGILYWTFLSYLILYLAPMAFWRGQVYRRKGRLVRINRIILRYLLYRSDVAPLNFSKFLQHAVQLKLMVRVGGGYKFLHRMLQEHFAQQQELPPAA